MSGHNIAQQAFRAEEAADPGSAGTITADRSVHVVPITTAAAEARTLARPTRAGGLCLLYMRADGGDASVTVTGGYDEAGTTLFTLTDPGQFVLFVAIYEAVANVYEWRKVADYNTAGVGMSETLTATRQVRADESGKTFFLNSATEFATTLPPLIAGFTCDFIVAAAPSGASYTIVSSASANIIKGQVYTLDVNSATDADFETSGGDTVSLVDGKSVAGDRVSFFCDGTNWFCYGFCSVFDAITITTAS